jgi:enoyl-CoA hydratase/carnithine racemase
MGRLKMNLTQSFAGNTIIASTDGHIGYLTISNAGRKNAVTLAMWQAIPEAMDWLAGDAGAFCILLKGDGSNDFSAGADISEFATVRKNTASALAYEAANSAAFAAIRTCRVPVIAVIRGICFGGGLGLAAACDFRIADLSARFSVPAAKLGLTYPVDAMMDIVSALGTQTARLALFTGRQFAAPELLSSDFLMTMTEPATLDETALGLAQDIVANAPLSVRASKTAIRAVLTNDPALFETAQKQGAATFESADYAEGRAAFSEKRKPQFTGR